MATSIPPHNVGELIDAAMPSSTIRVRKRAT
jgi:DNA gyrase/topoisomerase IV subunit A